jgi:hypothetical protein
VDLHHLLFAGFNRRTKNQDFRTVNQRRRATADQIISTRPNGQP